MGNGKPWNKKWSPPWLYFTQDLIPNSHTGSLLDLTSVQEIWMSPNPLTATASYFQWLSRTNLDTKPISTKSTKPQWLALAYWSDTRNDPMDLFCQICLSKVVTWTSHARQVSCFKYMCIWATACDALDLWCSMGQSCRFHQSDLDTQGLCMHHHRTAVSGVWIST